MFQSGFRNGSEMCVNIIIRNDNMFEEDIEIFYISLTTTDTSVDVINTLGYVEIVDNDSKSRNGKERGEGRRREEGGGRGRREGEDGDGGGMREGGERWRREGEGGEGEGIGSSEREEGEGGGSRE